MCPKCLSVLGPHCRPHAEENCPLIKSATCSVCGKGKHFQKDCPLKATVSPTKDIPNIPIKDLTKIYYMAHSSAVYIEYLQLWGIEITTNILRNRAIIAKHLLENGYTLVNPIGCSITAPCKCSRCVETNGTQNQKIKKAIKA